MRINGTELDPGRLRAWIAVGIAFFLALFWVNGFVRDGQQTKAMAQSNCDRVEQAEHNMVEASQAIQQASKTMSQTQMIMQGLLNQQIEQGKDIAVLKSQVGHLEQE